MSMNDDFTTKPADDPDIVYYHGRKEYYLHHGDRWLPFQETHLKNHLKVKAFKETKCRPDQAGSELDQLLTEINLEKRVDHVGQLAGYKPGLHIMADGRTVLVPIATKLIQPAPGDGWPALGFLLEGLFNGSEPDGTFIQQLPYFLGWLKLALEPLYAGKPRNGQAIIMAGDVHCGKTFLFEYVIERLMGGSHGQPYKYLSGQDDYNADLMHNALWLIDDETANWNRKSRVQFGKELKKITATGAYRFRGMYRDPVTWNTHRRLVMIVNLERQDLMVLPPLSYDLRDKVTLFRAYNGFRDSHDEFPHSTQAEKSAFLDQVINELPSFVHYLLHTHEIEPEHTGTGSENRFGIKAWHHPEIVQRLFAISPEADLLRMIDQVLFPTPTGDLDARSENIIISAQDLLERLRSTDNGLSHEDRKHLSNSREALGMKLAELAETVPGRLKRKRESTGAKWIIYKPSDEPEDLGM